jgi:hypothetical protein
MAEKVFPQINLGLKKERIAYEMPLLPATGE